MIPVPIVMTTLQATGSEQAVILIRTWSPITATTGRTRLTPRLLGTDRGPAKVHSPLVWNQTIRRAWDRMAILTVTTYRMQGATIPIGPVATKEEIAHRLTNRRPHLQR